MNQVKWIFGANDTFKICDSPLGCELGPGSEEDEEEEFLKKMLGDFHVF